MKPEEKLKRQRALIISYKVGINKNIETIEISNEKEDIKSLNNSFGNLLVLINSYSLELMKKIENKRKTIKEFKDGIELKLNDLVDNSSNFENIDIDSIKREWKKTEELINALILIN